MPESKVRKKGSSRATTSTATGKKKRVTPRRWVAPLMLAFWLLGVAWIVVNYIAGSNIPVMKNMGNWNLLVGMGLIAIGFVVSTQWE